MAKAKRSAITPASSCRRSPRAGGASVENVVTTASKRATANDPGASSALSPIRSLDLDLDSNFLAFPSLPDSHFLGMLNDSSLRVDPLVGSSRSLISLVRAKEIAQVKIAEALTKQKEAQSKQKEAAASSSRAVCTEEQIGDPERISLAEIVGKARKKKKSFVDLGPRENLRATPARQARALAAVLK